MMLPMARSDRLRQHVARCPDITLPPLNLPAPDVMGGVTVAESLRGASAGMRLLAEIAPGWRLGS